MVRAGQRALTITSVSACPAQTTSLPFSLARTDTLGNRVTVLIARSVRENVVDAYIVWRETAFFLC